MTVDGNYEGVDGLDVVLDDRVLRITLDRPDKRNALTDDMVAAFIDAIDEAGRDEAVRVILVSRRAVTTSVPASTSCRATRRRRTPSDRVPAASNAGCRRRPIDSSR